MRGENVSAHRNQRNSSVLAGDNSRAELVSKGRWHRTLTVSKLWDRHHRPSMTVVSWRILWHNPEDLRSVSPDIRLLGQPMLGLEIIATADLVDLVGVLFAAGGSPVFVGDRADLLSSRSVPLDAIRSGQDQIMELLRAESVRKW